MLNAMSCHPPFYEPNPCFLIKTESCDTASDIYDKVRESAYTLRETWC